MNSQPTQQIGEFEYHNFVNFIISNQATKKEKFNEWLENFDSGSDNLFYRTIIKKILKFISFFNL